MKLSKSTVQVLSNFASINANLYVKQGKVLATKAIANNILATWTSPEDFQVDFGIFNLSEFLAVNSLFTNPDLDFKGKWVELKEGTSVIKYFYADPSILSYPEKQIKMPAALVTIMLSKQNFAALDKAAKTLNVGDLTLTSDGDTLKAIIHDKENDTSNKFMVTLATGCTTEFSVNFKIENLKLIPDDYTISLTDRISMFVGKEVGVTYYVSMETGSYFK